MLIHTWNPNTYYHPESVDLGVITKRGTLHSLELQNCSLITTYNLHTPRILLFGGKGGLTLSCSGCNQGFLYSLPNWFHLVSLFNGISTFVDYLMPKPPLQKNSNGTSRREDKEFHTFLKGISSKVNVIARLKFELTYWNTEMWRSSMLATTLWGPHNQMGQSIYKM